MTRLDGKVAIVTGAARGQGAAEAILIADLGGRVMVADILDEEGEKTATTIGAAACYQHLDVASEADWIKAIAAVEHRWGRLDALVNNAGITMFQPIESMDVADYLRIINVDQLGVFLGMKTSVRMMAASGGGSIVNTASITATYGVTSMAAYSAAKAAVVAMTRVAALEFEPLKVRVNAISPGPVNTAMVANLTNHLPVTGGRLADPTLGPVTRKAEPDEIARFVAFLLSDDSLFCNGANYVIDGGATAGRRSGV